MLNEKRYRAAALLLRNDSRGTPSVRVPVPAVTQDMFNGKDAANARHLMEPLHIQFLTIHYSQWTHVMLRAVNDFEAVCLKNLTDLC